MSRPYYGLKVKLINYQKPYERDTADVETDEVLIYLQHKFEADEARILELIALLDE